MDSQEFSNRYLPYSRKLYAIAFRLLQRADEAEDAVQEVFVKAWQMREELAGHSSIEGWLVTMVKNLCIDTLRTRHSLDSECLDSAPPPDEPDTSVQEQLEQRDQLRQTLALLSQLQPLQQTILRMRLMREMEFADIAQATGLSEGNVRVQLTRARQQLKQLAIKHHIL